MTLPSNSTRVPCETADCRGRAERYVSCEGENSFPYCRECSTVLLRGGEFDCGPVDDPVLKERDQLQRNYDLAVSVIDRLVEHLDEAHPENMTAWPSGEKSVVKDWLMFKCFGEDHELYDDIMALPKTRKTWQR